MTTLELDIARAARKLIEDERDWYAAPLNCSSGTRRADGRVQRCSGAAIADAGAPWPSHRDLWEAVERQMEGDIPKFNLTHTHAEVLAAFDAAIAKLEAA